MCIYQVYIISMNDERVTSSDTHLDVGYRSTSSAIRGDTKPLLRPNYFLMNLHSVDFEGFFQYLTYHSNIYYLDDWHFCRMCQLFSPTHCEWGEAARHMRVKTHADTSWLLTRLWFGGSRGLGTGRFACWTLSLCVCACCGGNFRCISMAFWASHQLMRCSVDLWSAFRRMWRSHPQGPSVPRNLSGAEVLKERFLTQKPDLGC